MARILRDLVSFVIGLVEILLIFRFVLKLLGANPEASFVAWVYETSAPLLSPFLPAFPTPAMQGGSILEFTTLFAIFVYAFAGYIIQELLSFIDGKRK